MKDETKKQEIIISKTLMDLLKSICVDTTDFQEVIRMERFFINFSRPFRRNETKDLILTVDLEREIGCKIEFVYSCESKIEAAALQALIGKKFFPYLLTPEQQS